jgi:hypothetical protein
MATRALRLIITVKFLGHCRSRTSNNLLPTAFTIVNRMLFHNEPGAARFARPLSQREH